MGTIDRFPHSYRPNTHLSALDNISEESVQSEAADSHGSADTTAGAAATTRIKQTIWQDGALRDSPAFPILPEASASAPPPPPPRQAVQAQTHVHEQFSPTSFVRRFPRHFEKGQKDRLLNPKILYLLQSVLIIITFSLLISIHIKNQRHVVAPEWIAPLATLIALLLVGWSRLGSVNVLAEYVAAIATSFAIYAGATQTQTQQSLTSPSSSSSVCAVFGLSLAVQALMSIVRQSRDKT